MTNTVKSLSTYKVQVYIGQIKHNYGVDSAIDKKTVSNSIYLSALGLAEDMTADKKYHGGPERALHQYPAEHYAFWQQVFSPRSDAQARFEAPGMGENMSVLGMTEDNVCIGDQYQWGDAIIEVSQPRLPCANLNTRWDVTDISVQMQALSRCGWLYRVIKPGMVSQDDALIRIKRLESATTVKQVCELFFNEPLNKANLTTLIDMPALSPIWGDVAKKRLETDTVENWNFRLLGHA
ncbi:MOSC domain-containing protein [Moritella sp. 24]|uniref:MOSC domain-containing protein n=1 Tax=Moritella sp. 24 TaxID=2746230 RepID=UPI001BAAD2DC|nr:MOSC domain-containing protein [Moritella sp. 24]QUM76767.1 MOSC domain-containing protein [Moritella sp. 24]